MLIFIECWYIGMLVGRLISVVAVRGESLSVQAMNTVVYGRGPWGSEKQNKRKTNNAHKQESIDWVVKFQYRRPSPRLGFEALFVVHKNFPDDPKACGGVRLFPTSSSNGKIKDSCRLHSHSVRPHRITSKPKGSGSKSGILSVFCVSPLGSAFDVMIMDFLLLFRRLIRNDH